MEIKRNQLLKGILLKTKSIFWSYEVENDELNPEETDE